MFALVGCVILAVPGYYLEERIRGAREWKAYQADAQQRGIKLDFAAYIPPKIPDSENFASIPIFDAAFRASDENPSAVVPNPFRFPWLNVDKFPLLSDPNGQKPVDLAAWQKYFVKSEWLASAGDDAAANVLKALQRVDAPLAQLHAAARRPHCRFPVHWEKHWMAALPHLGLLQSATKIDALRMEAHLARGESGAALADFRDGLRLTTAISGEPALISGLVRQSNLTVLESAIWNGLAGRRWSDPELRSIDAELASLDLLKDFIFTVNSERAAQNELMKTLVADSGKLVELMNEEGMPKRSDGWLYYLYPSGWLYQTQVRSNRYTDELVAQFDPVHHRWHGERGTPSAWENITITTDTLRYLLFGMAAPFSSVVAQKHVQAATVLDQTRLACALERFRIGHGAYPVTLAELSPEFLPQQPMEVLNGEPYHYRCPDGEHFVLYSVGFDLHDDGGVNDPKLKPNKQKDWVWTYPAK